MNSVSVGSLRATAADVMTQQWTRKVWIATRNCCAQHFSYFKALQSTGDEGPQRHLQPAKYPDSKLKASSSEYGLFHEHPDPMPVYEQALATSSMSHLSIYLTACITGEETCDVALHIETFESFYEALGLDADREGGDSGQPAAVLHTLRCTLQGVSR